MQERDVRVLYTWQWFANGEKRGGMAACREVHEALEIQVPGYARDRGAGNRSHSITHCITLQALRVSIVMLFLDLSSDPSHNSFLPSEFSIPWAFAGAGVRITSTNRCTSQPRREAWTPSLCRLQQIFFSSLSTCSLSADARWSATCGPLLIRPYQDLHIQLWLQRFLLEECLQSWPAVS